MLDGSLLKSLPPIRQPETQAITARVDDLLGRLDHIRQQEARAIATMEALAASPRPGRQPLQLRLSSALRQLRAWGLGLLARPSLRRDPTAPQGVRQGAGRRRRHMERGRLWHASVGSGCGNVSGSANPLETAVSPY
jgi:hypothetical protein